MTKFDDTIYFGNVGSVQAASSTDLGSTSPNRRLRWNVTGAATINGFVVGANRMRHVTFAGVCTLVHSSTLVLPSSANITTEAGDALIGETDALENFTVKFYFRKSGKVIVAPTVAEISGAAPLASPTFTGTPAAPTATGGTNTTQIATTAFVKAALDALVAAAPGALDTLDELAAALGDDANFAATVTTALAAKAPLASPTLTGTPAAPTAAADTTTTQLATTAFVVGQAGSSTPAMDGTSTVGTSKKFARDDHIHPTDTSRAPLASPTFTGTPAGPTAGAGTNTTQLATTAFVKAAIDVVLGGVSAAFDTLSEIATDLALKALKATTISTTAPLAGGGDLSANRTLSINPAYFSVHKNGTDQTGIVDATLTTLTWSTERYDNGGKFASNKFTPAAGTYGLNAQANFGGATAAGGLILLTINKNGSILKQGLLYIASAGLGGSLNITVIDEANGTDFYEVGIYIDVSAGTGTVFGGADSTFFQGWQIK